MCCRGRTVHKAFVFSVKHLKQAQIEELLKSYDFTSLLPLHVAGTRKTRLRVSNLLTCCDFSPDSGPAPPG